MTQGKRHPLLTGTIILTLTGLISRIIGFFYRIYLSKLFGEEGMGIYQLLSPVLSLSFSLTAAGYQTAISKLVAEKSAADHRVSFRPLLAGLSISLPLSLLCTGIVYALADFIGAVLLSEPRTTPLLRILAFSLPFSSVHSCINGYFYGRKKAGIPAATQLVEQLVRVGCVLGISSQSLARGMTPSIHIAVLGLTVGELLSMLVSVIAIYICYARQTLLRQKKSTLPGSISPPAPPANTPFSPSATSSVSQSPPSVYRGLLGMALPLTANRIVLNLLSSIEAVSIPSLLKLYGYDSATALSIYGVLTGMAMPLIFFPNALTSSLSILLLPLLSESFALGNMHAVKQYTLRTLKYCFLMGFLCMCGFALFGNLAGRMLFHSPLAGYFISTLGFICPFLYLDTTLSGILQGLGMAGHIFTTNALCLLLRLSFLFFFIPKIGIAGYLWGLLASQLLLSVLYLWCFYRFCKKHSG